MSRTASSGTRTEAAGGFDEAPRSHLLPSSPSSSGLLLGEITGHPLGGYRLLPMAPSGIVMVLLAEGDI